MTNRPNVIEKLFNAMHQASKADDLLMLNDRILAVCAELDDLARHGQWLVIHDAMSSFIKVQRYSEHIPDEAIVLIAQHLPFNIRGIEALNDRGNEVQQALATNLVRFQGFHAHSITHLVIVLEGWITRGLDEAVICVLTDLLVNQRDNEHLVEAFIEAAKAAKNSMRHEILAFMVSNDHQISNLSGRTNAASTSIAVQFYELGMIAFASRLFERRNVQFSTLDFYRIHKATGLPPLGGLLDSSWLGSSNSSVSCAIAYTIGIEGAQFPEKFKASPGIDNEIKHALKSLIEDGIDVDSERAAILIDHLLDRCGTDCAGELLDIGSSIIEKSRHLKRYKLNQDLSLDL